MEEVKKFLKCIRDEEDFKASYNVITKWEKLKKGNYNGDNKNLANGLMLLIEAIESSGIELNQNQSK